VLLTSSTHSPAHDPLKFSVLVVVCCSQLFVVMVLPANITTSDWYWYRSTRLICSGCLPQRAPHVRTVGPIGLHPLDRVEDVVSPELLRLVVWLA
jgi:hypothetical protein